MTLLHYKPHIYLKTYPSGLKFWRVTSQRPGPWKRPSYSDPWSRAWGLAYRHAQGLNAARERS